MNSPRHTSWSLLTSMMDGRQGAFLSRHLCSRISNAMQGILPLTPLSSIGLHDEITKRFPLHCVTNLFGEIQKVIDDPQSDIQTHLMKMRQIAALQVYPGSPPAQFRPFITVGQRFEKKGPCVPIFFKRVLKIAGEASFLTHSHSKQRFERMQLC